MTRRRLAALFAVALAVRLTVLFTGPWSDPDRATFGDSPRYLTLAANLRQHGRFGLADEEPARAWHGLLELRQENGTQPPPDDRGLIHEVLRTPGYPLVIASATAVFGDPRGVLLLQCLLGAAAACCVARLGSELGLSPRPALVAGLLWALHPGLVARDPQFMTESLFNSLGVIGLTVAACGPRGWKGWVLAGAILGFAGLVRPLAAIYVPAAAVWAARRATRWWVPVLVLSAAAALPSLSWAARNAATGNGFRVSTVGNVTLFYYFAGYSISEERGADWLTSWPQTSEELLARLRARVRPGEDVYDAMRTLAVEELKARPGPAARVLVKSWVKLYTAHSIGELYHLYGAEYRPTNLMARFVFREKAPEAPTPIGPAVAALLWVGANVLLAGAALVGAIVSVRRRQFVFAVPLVLTVALFTIATMSQGMERFRSPFLFAMVLLAVAPWGLGRRDPGPRPS